MTRRLNELTVKREGRRVWVVPKIVVEVAYNEIQRSPKYKCGMALRFARIVREREDKSPEEADTIQRLREIYQHQVKKHDELMGGSIKNLGSQQLEKIKTCVVIYGQAFP